MRRFLLFASWILVIQTPVLGFASIVLLSGDYVSPGFPTGWRIVCIVLGGFLPIVFSAVALYDPRSAARYSLWIAPFAFLPFLASITGAVGGLQGFSGPLTIPLAMSFWSSRDSRSLFGESQPGEAGRSPLEASLWSTWSPGPIFRWVLQVSPSLAAAAIGSLSVIYWQAPIWRLWTDVDA